MNQLPATVKQVDKVDNLSIVTLNIASITLKLVTLELEKKIKPTSHVNLKINPNEIMIVKNFQGDISCSNQLKAKVIHLEKGQLLTAVELSFEGFKLESLITTQSAIEMTLEVGNPVLLVVKESAISVATAPYGGSKC
jgi:molybdopterin-binding protein